MIYLIFGATHTGKTNLAQKLLEKHHIPYLSLDHLKMGLIRSQNTNLTPEHDEALVDYLWPITREIIKTAIENGQNLIVEGCYIPFDWETDFEPEYREHIRSICLVMSQSYIKKHFSEIKEFANVIEQRLDDSYCTQEMLMRENQKNLDACRRRDLPYCLIDDSYPTHLPW